MISDFYEEISRFGRKLAEKGLTTASGGNLSIRVGESLYITSHGAMLEDIRQEDVVFTNVWEPLDIDRDASMDLLIHRRIYKETDNTCVMHTHPPYLIALSFFLDTFIPQDLEGRHWLKSIPVIDSESPSAEVAGDIAEGVAERRMVVVRGHGLYTGAKSILEAYNLTCIAENSAQIFYMNRCLSGHDG